ncbi:ABC transporter [Vulcanisaeta sp. EB80]|jgi:ABC-2 type transporter.|uniref:ABC transporter permease n=1 Tax=Vulcanisaeta sp. EB80 TaxID=1650660 RepID=UPI000747424D|nr:ABC transporter permease [Vulcanisaeta sp. EB80]KUO81506.1 MAG: ABC transporter [Vulcanisaeta sp. JCHS_4]MCG2864821.1 ABC transporter permease [Vulcanisaeta sp.]MCG2866342.1 ABC transporter permease [Vulcanisaeta sp.]MCG2885460.1 ABC transporter permease [Vulcanisaeta sp.]MDT7863521.1 ABC transporter permease [Vulcanisaeta sp.]
MRVSKLDALYAVMVNELKIISREPGGLVLLVLLPYFIAGGMAFIASFFARVTVGVFVRQFLGFEVLMLSLIMVQTGARFLWEERGGGRLEFLLVSPTGMYVILLGTSLVMVLVNIGAFTIASLPILYLNYGLVGMVKLIIALLTLFIGLLPLYGIGLLVAGIIMRLNDADTVANIVTPILTILSGATYPIYVLPWWIRGLVYILPMYQTFYSMYMEITGNASLNLVINLVLSAIAYLSLGVTTYAALERDFRRRGT